MASGSLSATLLSAVLKIPAFLTASPAGSSILMKSPQYRINSGMLLIKYTNAAAPLQASANVDTNL